MQAAIKRSLDADPLAKHATELNSKDDLLILATNRFNDLDSRDRLSTEHYKEAFYLLIGSCLKSTRHTVAHTLSDCNYTPRSIVLFFALEPLSISTPILCHSPVLGQLDFLQIIEMKGVDYAEKIAMRPDIGPSVIKRLREFSHPEIDIALEENDALKTSANERSADALFKEIGRRQKRNMYIEAEKLSEQPMLENQLTGVEQSLVAAAARGGRTEAPTVVSPQTNTFDFGMALEKSARAHSGQGMAVLMQKRLGLSYDTTQQVLADKSGDTLSVLLRSTDVPAAQANRILLLTFPSIGLSTHNAMRAIRFFGQLKAESCRTAVAEWPKAASSSASYQPYLQEGNSGRPVSDGRSTSIAVDESQSKSTNTRLGATG